ncbi:MAG TPA: chaperonin GroEL, partial [Nitrospirales bacterium]|nr:chaperonin GroEL [Nitrospirales bacterium]
VEDALHATKAAVEEGIVPGGGVSLVRCIPALDKLTLSDDQQIGVAIIKRALEEPLRQIAANAGHEASVVIAKVKEEKANVGFDAAKEQYTDMIKAGIIDPTKVVRSAMQNAASVAGLMLTTEVLVTEVPEKEKPMPMPPGGGGGMGGMEGMY